MGRPLPERPIDERPPAGRPLPPGPERPSRDGPLERRSKRGLMVCEATLWVGSGLLQVIEELCKPGWIVQKQPAHHCLKPRGPPIDSGIGTPRATACTISATTHQFTFLVIQKFSIFQPGEEPGLGVSTNIGHDSPMQIVRTSWPRPMAEPLMQLPHGITNPSQLQWSQLFVGVPGRLASNPIAQAANWLRAVGRSSTR